MIKKRIKSYNCDKEKIILKEYLDYIAECKAGKHSKNTKNIIIKF